MDCHSLLFAGVDYPMILKEAEKDADVVIWDGGNNDFPFYLPDLHITLVDALRPTDEEHYYPGEINVRMADVVLISKVDESNVQQAEEHAKHLKNITKPNTPVFYGESVVSPEAVDPETGAKLSEEEATNLVKGKRVLVIDDGPTLTHGGMKYGAGYVLAKQLGAAEIVDPRPNAQGSLKQVFEKFKHLENVLPAMGYGDEQVKDLEATIHATPCDAIVVGTPSDIFHLMDLEKPFVTARYNLEVMPQHREAFEEYLDSFFDRYNQHHQGPPPQAA